MNETNYPQSPIKGFTFEVPKKKIIFDLGSSKNLTSEVKRLGGSKALLVSDENLVKLDFIRDIVNSIDKMGIETKIYSTNVAKSTIDVAEDIAVYVRNEGMKEGMVKFENIRVVMI